MWREAPEIRLAPVATVARDPCPMKPPSGARLGRASAFRPNGGHHRLLGVDELDLRPRKGGRQAGLDCCMAILGIQELITRAPWGNLRSGSKHVAFE
jgi:hypothetical protein